MRPKGRQSRNKGESSSRVSALCSPKPSRNKRIRVMADWSRLPSHLVDHVAGLLMVPDQARMAAVCKAWREAMSDGLCCRRPVPGIWIILRDGTIEPFHDAMNKFVSFSGGLRSSYCLSMPSKNVCIVGSTQGWIMLQDKCHHCLHAFHPIFRTSIPFPKTDVWIKKVVFLPQRHVCQGAVKRSALAIVLRKGFCGMEQRELSIAFAGDKVWRALPTSSYIHFVDIVAYEGKLYALGKKNEVVVFDLDGKVPSSSTLEIVNGSDELTISDEYSYTKHIGVICGELVIVRRGRAKLWSSWPISQFEVSRLQKNKENRWNWLTTEDLAGHAIMYNYDGVIALPVKDHEELQADCIYFMDGGDGTMSVTVLKLKGEIVSNTSHSIHSISWPTPLWFLL